MECTYSGIYDIPHSKKRRLRGSEKTRALTIMLNELVNPSVFHRNENRSTCDGKLCCDAREIMRTLDDVPKTLDLNGQTYYIRGTIIFNSGLRVGLRVISGHYKAFACRTNTFWEVYDDIMKDSISQPKPKQNNIEVLIYTL